MDDKALIVAVAIIRPEVTGEPDLIKRLQKAMKAAVTLWLDYNEEDRFRIALAAVLVETTNEQEKQRIIKTTKALRALAALIKGVPVDVEQVLDESDGIVLLPLRSLWDAAKGGRSL